MKSTNRQIVTMSRRGLLAALCALIPAASFALDVPLVADSYTIGPTGATPDGADAVLYLTSARRSWMMFDLTKALPAGTTWNQVSKAYLRVFAPTVPTAGSVSVVAANSAWTEEAITHSNAPVTSNDPGTGLPYATTAFTTISVNDYYTFDVTELVRDWLDGTKTNHGIVLMAAAATPSVSVTFISKEAASKGHQPTLHIVLAGPQGPTGATGLTG